MSLTLTNQQIKQFERELSLSNEAQKVLNERLNNQSIIKEFNLGFCPPTSSFEFNLLNGRLIVPIYDTYGSPIALAGRKIDYYNSAVKDFYKKETDSFKGVEKYLKWRSSKWINTPYKKANYLYNLNNAKKSIYENNFAIIVEGYFDVIHLYSLGFHNVVALCGTNLSSKQCELLFRYCDKIVLVLDGDTAGKIYSEKNINQAHNNNLFVSCVELPENCDPDDLNYDQVNFIKNEIINNEEEILIKF